MYNITLRYHYNRLFTDTESIKDLHLESGRGRFHLEMNYASLSAASKAAS